MYWIEETESVFANDKRETSSTRELSIFHCNKSEDILNFVCFFCEYFVFWFRPIHGMMELPWNWLHLEVSRCVSITNTIHIHIFISKKRKENKKKWNFKDKLFQENSSDIFIFIFIFCFLARIVAETIGNFTEEFGSEMCWNILFACTWSWYSSSWYPPVHLSLILFFFDLDWIYLRDFLIDFSLWFVLVLTLSLCDVWSFEWFLEKWINFIRKENLNISDFQTMLPGRSHSLPLTHTHIPTFSHSHFNTIKISGHIHFDRVRRKKGVERWDIEREVERLFKSITFVKRMDLWYRRSIKECTIVSHDLLNKRSHTHREREREVIVWHLICDFVWMIWWIILMWSFSKRNIEICFVVILENWLSCI